MTAKVSGPSNRGKSGPKKRAVKMSNLGALRRAKAMRLAVKAQTRLNLKLEELNRINGQMLVAQETLREAMRQLTESATTATSQFPSEVGEATVPESATEDDASSEPSTTSDQTEVFSQTELQTSTPKPSRGFVSATGALSESSGASQ